MKVKKEIKKLKKEIKRLEDLIFTVACNCQPDDTEEVEDTEEFNDEEVDTSSVDNAYYERVDIKENGDFEDVDVDDEIDQNTRISKS